MPGTGHPADPLRQGRGVTGSDVFPQTCTAHRSYYTDWNNRIEYHRFELWTAFMGQLSMAPAGTERLRMRSPQNAACAHPWV